MPATHVEFTPSVSATLQANPIPMTVTLPDVDPANPVMVLQNQGPGPVAIIGGSVTWSPLDYGRGTVLKAGQVLLTHDAGLAGSTVATVQAQGGATLVFTRGKLADLWLFPAP